MRKRSTLLVAALLSIPAGLLYAQDSPTGTTQETENTRPRKEYTHWSVELKGGLSALRGGNRDTGQAEILSGKLRPALGISVEHTFNPLWGLALEYMYIDYSNWGYDALSHEGALVGQINLSNLLSPRRTGGWKKINFYGHMGAGVSSYSYERQDISLPPLNKSGLTVVMPTGFSGEWNLSKTFALNLRGEYRWHSSTGMLAGRTFQPGYGFWVGTGGLRIKFGGARHVKNFTIADYNRKADEALIDQYIEQRMEQRMAQYRQETDLQINSIRITHDKDVRDLTAQVEALQRQINELRDSLRSRGISTNDIILNPVEFNTGSHIIRSGYNSYLSALAVLLKNHDNWFISMSGHTDNTGAESKNLTLSEDRAAQVEKYLVSRGASPAVITRASYADNQPKADNVTPEGRQKNRRVEIRLIIK